MPNVQDDFTLLHRARSLDPEAIEEIHDTYYVPIYRYIIFKVDDHQTSEDLTSEVFSRLLQALQDRTAPVNTIRGWLFSVAAKVVSDYYRKQYQKEKTNLDNFSPTPSLEPYKSVEAKATEITLLQAVSNLSDDQKEVIALRFGYEMPIKEVANTIGKSIGSVKMLQARAILSLSKSFLGEKANQ